MGAADLEQPQWGPLRTSLFRWFVIFVLAYIAPLEVVTDPIIPWVGNHVLGFDYEIVIEMSGSGDTTAEYVRLFVHAVFGVIGTAIWALVRSPRARYVKGLHWFTLALRLTLALFMASYGFAKVFDGQFLAPDASRLLTPYGESSPMGLLWTFMGSSKAYSVFAGLAEVVGGILLLSRRTQTLGALIVVGVMANVVMLNFCYDVPVKLLSTRLLVMAMFIAGLDYRRLLAIFVTQQTVEARSMPQLYSRPRAHLAGQIAKSLFAAVLVLGYIIGFAIMSPAQSEASADVLTGLYEVDSYQREGEEAPPLLTDEDRWRRFVVGRWGVGTVQGMDDGRKRYKAEVDEETSSLKLVDRDDEGEDRTVFDFTYTRAETEDGVTLVLTNDELRIALHEVDLDTFVLHSRGFRWIQEHPFNR